MRANTKTVWTLLAAAGGLVMPGVVRAQVGPLAQPFPPVLDATSLDGVIGLRIDGADASDSSGLSVAPAGDINGDGIDDLIIGVARFGPGAGDRVGSGYVVFGREPGPAGLPAALDLGTLDGTNGFRIDGAEGGDVAGARVAAAGDVNGDGLADLIIGAFRARPGGRVWAGSAYLVFGRDVTTVEGFPPVLSVAGLDGIDGVRLDGVAAMDLAGFSVAGAGDVNGDGVDDVVIGARYADPGGRADAGSSYLVFGRDVTASEGFPPVLALVDLDGADGFRIDGVSAGDNSGYSVAGAGDVNDDGVADLLVGAYGADPAGRANAGSSYIVFGRGTAGGGFPAVVELTDLDGSNGFRVDGQATLDSSGLRVGPAGDFNGDGFDDVIISAPGADPAGLEQAGSSYVVFGRGGASGAFPALLELAELDGTNGIRLDGHFAHRYGSLPATAAGDFNGDGLSDVVIGVSLASPEGVGEAGSSYIVFGRADRLPATFSLGELDGATGFRFDGEAGNKSGWSVASAGDFNNDGRADIAIGAISARPGGRTAAGSTYVVFGRSTCRADLDGDGALTIFDFLAFGNLFDLMDPIADFDGDGEFTLFDFLAFQNAFDAGC